MSSANYLQIREHASVENLFLWAEGSSDKMDWGKVEKTDQMLESHFIISAQEDL